METKEARLKIKDEDEDDEHSHLNNENVKCRLYRKDFPDEGDLVIVR